LSPCFIEDRSEPINKTVERPIKSAKKFGAAEHDVLLTAMCRIDVIVQLTEKRL